jgi:hypothetical protein
VLVEEGRQVLARQRDEHRTDAELQKEHTGLDGGAATPAVSELAEVLKCDLPTGVAERDPCARTADRHALLRPAQQPHAIDALDRHEAQHTRPAPRADDCKLQRQREYTRPEVPERSTYEAVSDAATIDAGGRRTLS